MSVTPLAASPSHILDNPTWAALTGPHAHFARRIGHAVRYPRDMAPFHAMSDGRDPRAWADLAALVEPGGTASVRGITEAPADWEVLRTGQGVQLVDTSLRAAPDSEAVRLGPDDVPEILDLVARTTPGPYLPRTVEMGTYLGIRHRGRLVAMAGERLHPPGWTEISAVCTDPDHRGRGLATRLVRAVAAGIRERGERPFLHAAATNTNAIRLYESIGFTLRRRTVFSLVWYVGVATPGATTSGRRVPSPAAADEAAAARTRHPGA
ncbi:MULTISPECIES: GNAT family N-acetyltransferase [unclassified Streptomyces]|uniref:GNAT family N-acetyltransferase n=1 Tax=unclassified Streptomyces TaxID=2593676 RepID=UPI003322108A